MFETGSGRCRWVGALAGLLAWGLGVCVAHAATPAERVEAVLKTTPLIDGHNDAPWQYRHRVDRRLADLDFAGNLGDLDPPMHTDIPRLRRGQVGGQFWSVFVPVSLVGPDAVVATMEQIDLVHRLVERHSEALALALTADEIVAAHQSGRVASLIGIEGGHAINDSLAVLRQMYRLGARYMTLTHWKTLAWVDAATDEPRHGGLSPFGRVVVAEMNRLGMLVDLSHVSAETMQEALEISKAPVIFSHSSARTICGHPRNVPDDVLRALAVNGGVAMVTFLPSFVSEPLRLHIADKKAQQARLEYLHPGDPERVKVEIAGWLEAHPAPKATLAQVADHIDHIRKIAGIDHIGLGGDFDGMFGGPVGLEDVSKYPALLAELIRRGYADDDLRKIAGLNLLRALRAAEQVAGQLARAQPASEARIESQSSP